MKNGFFKVGVSKENKPKDGLVQTGKSEWMLMWGVTESDGECYGWRKTYDHKPGEDEVRADLCALINEQTEEKILHGLVYEGVTIWLSKENQMNFKAAHDLAVQTEGETLPVTLKAGEDENGTAIVMDFKTQTAIHLFWVECYKHIQKCLEDGWNMKAQVDYEALCSNS